MRFSRTLLAVSLSAALAGAALSAHAEIYKGPSSSETPYVVASKPGVHAISLITVGDSVNDKPDSKTPYRMVGIPDGLGAFDNHDGTFTVLMNHEIGPANGVVRQHGATGAFVSKWIVRKSDLAVLHGGDLTKQLQVYDRAADSWVPATAPMGRLCSADLPAGSAFYNRKTGNGYTGLIFMNGEEVGPEGRAFAHIVTGPGAGLTYELPSLGRFSWENSVASPVEQDKTVVIGTDDSTPGQVYVYIGVKKAAGNEVEKAGLHGGNLYGVRVVGHPVEDRSMGIPRGTRFNLHNHGDVRQKPGATLDAESRLAGVTDFLRPEDGAWDTRNPNVFYFVTTDRFDSIKDPSGATGVPPVQFAGRSRLYRLTFDDIRDPESGGRIDTLLDGTEPQQMLDNMTVDADGNLILQEDPGEQPRLAKIWKYYPRTDTLVEVAHHDPARFTSPTPARNRDEEASGVIEITHLLAKHPHGWMRFDWEERDHDRDDDEIDERFQWAKRGYRYYLSDTQWHKPNADPELVEHGQLYILAIPRNVR